MNDTTYEKLQVICSENPGGILSFQDEPIGWIDKLNSPGNEAYKSFVLGSWSQVPHAVDRIGRHADESEAPFLVLEGVTPHNLERFINHANEKSSLDDGLLQRFQVSVYPDQQDWTYTDREPNAAAIAHARATYERLLKLDPTKPADYRFDPKAQVLFKTWLTKLEEEKIRSGALHPALVSHLSKWRSLSAITRAVVRIGRQQ